LTAGELKVEGEGVKVEGEERTGKVEEAAEEAEVEGEAEEEEGEGTTLFPPPPCMRSLTRFWRRSISSLAATSSSSAELALQKRKEQVSLLWEEEQARKNRHRLSVDVIAALVVHTAHGAVGLAIAVVDGESQSRGRKEEREKDEPLDLALTALEMEEGQHRLRWEQGDGTHRFARLVLAIPPPLRLPSFASSSLFFLRFLTPSLRQRARDSRDVVAGREERQVEWAAVRGRRHSWVCLKRKRKKRGRRRAPFLSVALGWQNSTAFSPFPLPMTGDDIAPGRDESERFSPCIAFGGSEGEERADMRCEGSGGGGSGGWCRRVQVMKSSTETGSSDRESGKRGRGRRRKKRESSKSSPRRRVLLQHPLLVQNDSVHPSVDSLRPPPSFLTLSTFSTSSSSTPSQAAHLTVFPPR
jgi:hypothetical protein